MIAPLRGIRALLIVRMEYVVSFDISYLSSAIESTTPVTRTPTKEYPKL
jgi:hypothetical protein